MVYRNTTLYTKRATHPVRPLILGPLMLCMLKDKATYVTLFQKMTAKMPGLKAYLHPCCSDGEKPLCEALSQEFERSVAFLCKSHVNCNIQDKCSNLKISKALTSIIVNYIFDSEGLAYASNKRQFKAIRPDAELGRFGMGRHDKRASILIIFSQVQSGRNLESSEYKNVEGCRIW